MSKSKDKKGRLSKHQIYNLEERNGKGSLTYTEVNKEHLALLLRAYNKHVLDRREVPKPYSSFDFDYEWKYL